jgi:hypothetical protein
MQRIVFIERTLRQIYGNQPSQDSAITVNLVNSWLQDAIGLAVKANYKDSISLDGIAYINDGFYTTFKGLTLKKDETFLYKIILPDVPMGLGRNEGNGTLLLKDSAGNLSYPIIWLDQNQKGYSRSMRQIPNKLLGYQEGGNAYILTTLVLDSYTANYTMVSGGDSTNLNSELNVPADYFPIMVQYIEQQLLVEQSRPRDIANEGVDLGNKS